jgi:primosomal replication protein N
MAGSVNRVVLLGTIGKYGVTMSFHTTDTPKASFTLVLTEKGQDGQYYSTLVPVEIWGKHAEAVSDLEPGTVVLFDGKVARRKKGEQYELVMSGLDLTPITPAAVLAGSGGEHEH